MRVETIGETVKVRADFAGGSITPLMFKRGGRTYRIKSINSRWIDRQHRHPIYYFSVEAGGDMYELAFRTGEAIWRLERVVLD
ncbi:MAG: hypothetical protein E3J72_22810 [Planctomycetota bacterium]|nr:MAG: hypothetical protein E3J72_22810 [Planctomycetota bacterium]